MKKFTINYGIVEIDIEAETEDEAVEKVADIIFKAMDSAGLTYNPIESECTEVSEWCQICNAPFDYCECG
jgi:hypothetical protein